MKSYGPVIVAIGAISYGMPATLMKLANQHESNTGGILFFSFLFSVVFLNISFLLQPKKNKQNSISLNKKFLVATSGISIAMTNICYFFSLSFVTVAISAVMMMQSVWIAIAISCCLRKSLPTLLQFFIVILILIGTLFATDVLTVSHPISFKGIALGFTAAFFYALTIQFTGKLAPELPALQKASLMSIGAFILISFIWAKYIFLGNIIQEIQWGASISLFAMIIPLSCFSFGMPRTSPGTGEIISSLELPSAIIFALIFLGEAINMLQLCGIITIIGAVMLISIKPKEI